MVICMPSTFQSAALRGALVISTSLLLGLAITMLGQEWFGVWYYPAILGSVVIWMAGSATIVLAANRHRTVRQPGVRIASEEKGQYERALRDFYRRALVVVFALVGGMLFLLGFFYTLSALDLTSAVRQPLIWLGIVVFGVIQIGSLIYYNRFTCPRCQKLFRPLNTGHGQPRCVGCRLSILEIKQFAR